MRIILDWGSTLGSPYLGKFLLMCQNLTLYASRQATAEVFNEASRAGTKSQDHSSGKETAILYKDHREIFV